MSAIFSPLTLRGMTVKNRIVMSPMLMYMAGDDGKLTDLHFVHYGARALGGVGLVMTEVVAVEPRGRISHQDLGIWNDAQVEGLQRLTTFLHQCGAKAGIQLAHAGRKAALREPGVAPSAIRYSDDAAVPVALTTADLAGIVEAYAAGARRAHQAGFDCIEIHAAHGYLLHEFLAPRSNRRDDLYGGALENRACFPLEVIAAVRRAWPDDKPLMVRMSAADLVEGGVTPEEAVWFARQLKALGIDLLEASSGNIVPGYPAPIVPGYQVKYADRIKRETGLPTATVGSITSSELAESIVASGSADLVFLGRELLRNPFWVLQAAQAANVALELPIPTYARATGPYTRGF
jgi:NADPH2 dehydrogenase